MTTIRQRIGCVIAAVIPTRLRRRRRRAFTAEQAEVLNRVAANGQFDLDAFLLFRERGIDMPKETAEHLLYGNPPRPPVTDVEGQSGGTFTRLIVAIADLDPGNAAAAVMREFDVTPKREARS